jgi:hypothetical protein
MARDIGIDYSLGKSNFDKKTGIHYGVIHQGEVLQAWTDSSEAEYPEPETCKTCNGTGLEDDTDNPCPDCDGEGTLSDDFSEPIFFYLDDGEYKASQTADDPDIFILKSPFYTLCQFCSPCAPGAGSIMNTVENGIKAYCFGHDWFESGKAPYPVYSVKTNELIESEEE